MASTLAANPEGRENPCEACWPVWSPTGDWADVADWSVQDATKVTRGEARAKAVPDYEFTGIGVWKRHIRCLTRQEQWESSWDFDEGLSSPPDGWCPDEETPVWEFCLASHPEAWPVWVVAPTSEGAPPVPSGGGDGE